MNMPEACPGLEENVSLDDERFGACYIEGLIIQCPDMCDQSLVSCPASAHEFLSPELYKQHKGHLMALFRQLEQRLLSQYYNDEDLWRA